MRLIENGVSREGSWPGRFPRDPPPGGVSREGCLCDQGALARCSVWLVHAFQDSHPRGGGSLRRRPGQDAS